MFVARVCFVQVQTESVKVGSAPKQVYTPEPIKRVDQLSVERDGCTDLEAAVFDVHHVKHDKSKNRRGVNGVSFGFTSHYLLMNEFSVRDLGLGEAGENIVLESDRVFDLSDLSSGLRFSKPDGSFVGCLEDIDVITPCRTFTRFVLNDQDPSPDLLKETFDKLGGGVRGFFGRPVTSFVVEPGDIVSLAE